MQPFTNVPTLLARLEPKMWCRGGEDLHVGCSCFRVQNHLKVSH